MASEKNFSHAAYADTVPRGPLVRFASAKLVSDSPATTAVVARALAPCASQELDFPAYPVSHGGSAELDLRPLRALTSREERQLAALRADNLFAVEHADIDEETR